jgi:hypothetical protein
MRVSVDIPEDLIGALQDQARAAHRPPRYHLEWLIVQALQEQPDGERHVHIIQKDQQQAVTDASAKE